MSFILDALNKAQREREEQREPVPQLTTVHYTPEPVAQTPPRNNQKIAVTGGALALCALALAGGYGMFSGGQGAEESTLSAAPAATSPAPVSSPVESPARSDQAQANVQPYGEPVTAPPPTEESEKAAVADLYQSAQSEASAPPNPGAAVAAPPQPKVQPRYGALDRQRPTTAPSVAVSQPSRPTAVIANPTPVVVAPIPVEVEPAPEVEAQPEDSIATRIDVPYLQQLSWATQQRLPSLLYSEHHYHENPAQRSVVINGTTQRAGSQIAGGLVLQEILQDGAILQFESRPFKVDALNSWVNF